jgi:hypothetical protein
MVASSVIPQDTLELGKAHFAFCSGGVPAAGAVDRGPTEARPGGRDNEPLRARAQGILASLLRLTGDISFAGWAHRLGRSSEAREDSAGRNKRRLER